MPKVAFKTLGCRLNQAETDLMAEQLASAGYELVRESDDPDLIIVNTCTVTTEATRGSRRMAASLARNHPASRVVVAGCYAVAEPHEAASIPGVDAVIGNDDKQRVLDAISSIAPIVDRSPLLSLSRRPQARRARVNLKVQTGCDEFCSFCIIPYTRGALRSDPLEGLLSRARDQVAMGARELVLTGVHLGKYGWDRGSPDDALIELLDGLLAIEGLARIRLSSILCRHITDGVIELFRTEEKLCRFLHVPLQAGDDETLESMNRPYNISEYLETVQKVKEVIPGVALSTDVIVGFPGETGERFSRTMQVVEQVGFMKLHVFRYSPRPGTPAATRHDQLTEDVKKARSKELISLGSRLRYEFNEAQVGSVREVLVEQEHADGRLSGHTDDFAHVRFEAPTCLIDKLALIEITDAGPDSVSGRFVREVAWSDADPRALKSTAAFGR